MTKRNSKLTKIRGFIAGLSEFETPAVIGMTIVHLCFFAFFFVSNIEGKFWLGQLFGPVVFVTGYAAIGAILASIFRWILKVKSRLLTTVLILMPITVRLLQSALGWELALATYLLSFVCIVLGSTCIAQLVTSKKLNWLSGLGCLVFLSSLIYGYSEFTHRQEMNHFLSTLQTAGGANSLTPLASRGEHSYSQLTYGSGNDLHRIEYADNVDIVSSPVDGSLLLDNWSGMTAFIRKAFWGFDASELPVQGRVWLPDTTEKSPLVLMVHGNHAMENFSDKGYDYLGEHLASRGYTFVSVDQNFLNGTNAEGFFGFGPYRLFGENDARGWLLLKHLQQWREWIDDVNSPFFNRVNLDNIILVGHSRGGEGAFIAAHFNEMNHYPDNAKLTFDFDFNIKGIVSIAPSDTHYQPRGSLAANNDVSYLTLQGTEDGDATVFMGAAAYSRINFTGSDEHFKSSIMIHGANHSQFNSEWGHCDKIPFLCALTSYGDLTMGKDLQQRLAKGFITAFVESVVDNGNDFRHLFLQGSKDVTTESLPFFTSNYLDSSAVILANYEDDGDISTANIGQIEATNFTTWKELKMRHHGAWEWTDLSTHAVKLSWNRADNNIARYSLSLPAHELAKDCFGFSIANANNEIHSATITNFSVSMTDSMGSTGIVELSDFKKLYPSLLRKPDASEPEVSEPTFQAVQFPLDKIFHENNAWKANKLLSIEFVFDQTPTGSVYIDDIHLANCVSK